jgi:hypothetical protein
MHHTPRLLLTASLLAAPFTSCEVPSGPAAPPAPVNAPASATLMPATLAGWIMRYTDNHSVNTWTFSADGTCVMKAVHHSGTDTNIVKSKWKWKPGAGTQARLILDGKDTLTLEFSAPLKATGTWDYDMRGYACEFIPPAGAQ